MIITRTPFRISFFGGGTDYPIWFQEHGGAVLATTIDKFCYISCRYLPPFFEHHSRIVYSRVELVRSLDEIEHPAVRECLRFAGLHEGIEIHHDGDLPHGTGMGTSSSFTVGMLHALYALKGLDAEARQLALDAVALEQDVLRENVGCQDQVLAALGGFNVVRFAGTRSFEVEPVTVPAERLRTLEQHLMLVFTGFARTASTIAAEQIRSTPAKYHELTAMRNMVDEGLNILCHGDLCDFGRLLHEGWRLKRSLSAQIASPAIDEIYATARGAGALGGKLLGAGGGGFMLLFAVPEAQPTIRARLSGQLHVPFRFEHTGSRVIFRDDSAINVHQGTRPVP